MEIELVKDKNQIAVILEIKGIKQATVTMKELEDYFKHPGLNNAPVIARRLHEHLYLALCLVLPQLADVDIMKIVEKS